MNEEMLRVEARKRAEDFLANSSDFRLGDIEAEQSHPVTRNMSEVFASSVQEGLSMLTECDALLAPKVAKTLQSDEFAQLEGAVFKTLNAGGRIILSGCGSSGRLCMRIENSFRKAIQFYGQEARKYEDKVLSLQTGGDYAVIRAVEFFEDFAALGRHQAEEFGLTDKDMLIGVTATGETTSILGSAARALDDGASVFMVVCSNPDHFYGRIPRAATVYRRPKTSVLFLPCGPMALTGSTRMQSSTYEQAVLGIAFDRTLTKLMGGEIRPLGNYAKAFEDLTRQISAAPCIEAMAEQVILEEKCYGKHGLITYFADEYMLDVLTDTTERSPTFMTPPFVSKGTTGQVESWAFVKNPNYDTITSWERCFRRPPRCIEWSKDEFAFLGLETDIIDKIPPIGHEALYKFVIGHEAMPERETPEGSTAVWIGAGEAPASFEKQAMKYHHHASFTLKKASLVPEKTTMDIFEHLGMKMLLNNVSTATMVRMGRVHGNWMTFLNISNKKLIDRAARIIALFSKLPYERALEELFYTEEMFKQNNDKEHSSTQETLRRLKKQIGGFSQ